MDRPPCALVFALGAVGASALEIVRLYELRHEPPKGLFSRWYWIISVVYAVLGGVVAVALPAITLWAAFYAGMSLPAIVSTAAKHRKRRTILAANERDRVPIEPPHPGELQAARATWPKTVLEALRRHADGLFL
jgi:hypothetical protein